ncbi:1341_t:CDS:2 [Dentiscutata erythropus]|uniref:1341_t:CDS:1 n=1 Tax=Dentiscutata erythropus TaxID=1348616 RepID=A0A9N8YZP5_9GLOM|nr:1341_t:CDS:2 [Dentiscutata erythropus]
MSNSINLEETVNVPLLYLMQLQYLAIQSIEKIHNTKQSEIVAANKNISNNEVSKEIGNMWNKESLDVKMKFQVMADIAKLNHMQKYPEYKYQPHRKKRRSKRNCEFSINETKSKTNHENYLLSEQLPPLNGEINSENNVFVDQNLDKHSLQLISNNLNLSNEISENSQEVANMFNYHFIFVINYDNENLMIQTYH